MKHFFTLLLLVTCISHTLAQLTINTPNGPIIEQTNEPTNKSMADCRPTITWSMNVATACAGAGPIFTAGNNGYHIIDWATIATCANTAGTILLEVSDGSGNFANAVTVIPVFIGEYLRDSEDTPDSRLPAHLPFGTNYRFRLRNFQTGDLSSEVGPLTILPVSITLTSDQSCFKPGTSLTVTDVGAASYQFSSEVSQPGGLTSNTGIATTSGTYSVTVTNPAGCTNTEVTTSLLLPACYPALVLSYTPSVPLSSPSVTLRAFVQGTSFVLTGPNGYVFSAVYRTPGQYMFYAPDVKQPGQYLLTVYGDNGSMQQVTITVTG